jgi:hypothetical protein
MPADLGFTGQGSREGNFETLRDDAMVLHWTGDRNRKSGTDAAEDIIRQARTVEEKSPRVVLFQPARFHDPGKKKDEPEKKEEQSEKAEDQPTEKEASPAK